MISKASGHARRAAASICMGALIVVSSLVEIASTAAADETKASDALAAAAPAGHYSDFQNFWEDFQAAVGRNDFEAMADQALLPLATRGESDFDPVIPVDRARLIRNLPMLLAADPGILPYPTTQQILLLSEDAPDIDQGGSVRIGDFVFEKVDGRWWWVFAYADTDALR